MSPEAPDRLIVLRYGELFLKGGNRPYFERLLHANVRRALASIPATIERGQGRLFVRCAAGQEQVALEQLRRVFGLSSLSPAYEVPPVLEEIAARALQLVLARPRPASFRVTARRSDKRFPHNSQEINREVGARIFETTEIAVDLSHPELVVGVEVGTQASFIYLDSVVGAGGLPVGCSGAVALLLSGGIDSPVAGYLLQKRGCVLHPIYFHSFPYTGERSRDKVVQLAAQLAIAQPALTLHVVPFTAAQIAIRDQCPAELAVVLYRRMMMRIASTLARQNGCLALATGENLGQVASQTLENLASIALAATLPVLRPLLTFDKTETIELARRIGSYALSIQPYEDCCSLFVPRHPITRSNPEQVARAEARLDVQRLVDEAVAGTEHCAVEE